MIESLAPRSALSIYGIAPCVTFPASATRCLSGIAIVDDSPLQVVDGCAGLLVQLQREPI